MPNNLTTIPAARAPLVDPSTGLIATEWYRFLFNIYTLAGSGSNTVSLDDLQLGPPPQPPTTSGGGGGSGTVTSVATGTGLTGGPITTTGTIDFAVAAVGTWAATPSSANLRAAMTDETGTGALVFANTPTLVTPILGTPTSGDFSTGTFTWPTFNQNTTGYAAGLAGGLIGSLPYQSAINTTVFLAAGTNGQVLTLASGVPSWATPTTGTVTSVSGTGTVNGITLTGTVTSSGSLTLGGTLDLSSPPAIGGTTPNTGRFSDLTDTGLTSGRVTYAGTGGNLVDSANLTFNGTTLVANDITDTSLTATRVVYAGAGGNLVNASNFTYDGTNLVAGAIQNTPIGATTPSTVNATTITGQTGVLRGTGQNLVLRSQALTTAPWSLNAAPTTASTTDPLGGSTATQFTTSAGNSGVFQFPSVLNGATLTWSIFVRYISGDGTLRLGVETSPTTANLVFNSSAGTITSTGAGLTATSVTNIGSGWYRVSGTFVSTGSTVGIVIYSNNANASSFAAWGVQIEIGSVLNTYIPTTTTAVYGTPTLSFSGVSTIGLESNGALFLQPAGTGALQAQATTSTTAGGNARGANAVDWQTSRSAASQVASGVFNVISGGRNNTASSFDSAISGGATNTISSDRAFIGGGDINTVNGSFSSVVGGKSNTSAGFFNFVGGGFTNSGTANAAVTTQSGTMNGTTAVTLSGSNANIRVGQYITGTSIAGDTYVAAISGTSLTLSKNASGSSTSTLSFFTPHGVVVGGGNNQATGSYSFIGGGGDAGTAGNRNVASGDWSSVAGGNVVRATGKWSTAVGGGGNLASGEASFVGGGGSFGGGLAGNTASATSAFVGAGYSNTAAGYCSTTVGGAANNTSNNFSFIGGGSNNTSNGGNSAIIGGTHGTTRGITGNHIFPACDVPIAGSAGVSQAGLLVLGVQTTDATATVLRSTTAAASTINQVILPNNSAYYFRGSVIAGVTGAGNAKAWSFEGAIERGANAASTTIVGTVILNTIAQDAGASTWIIAITADTTNGGLRVTVTGQLATTIRWVCKIETTEMTY